MKNRNFKYYIAVSLFVFSFNSCNVLDEEPFTQPSTENFYQNEIDALSALTSVYARLKNINIGYNFDLKNGKNMRVYLAGQNLIVWTDYPGYDPEVRTYTKNPQKRGVDFGTYPGTRSLLVGLKLNY